MTRTELHVDYTILCEVFSLKICLWRVLHKRKNFCLKRKRQKNKKKGKLPYMENLRDCKTGFLRVFLWVITEIYYYYVYK